MFDSLTKRFERFVRRRTAERSPACHGGEVERGHGFAYRPLETKPELRAAGQDEPMRIVERRPALDENEADSRAPSWAKMVLGLGFLLTGLWSGLILWAWSMS